VSALLATLPSLVFQNVRTQAHAAAPPVPHNRSIVGFIGTGVGLHHGDPKRSFLVQELMAGGTLKALVQRQMLQNPTPLYSDAAALDMCIQVAKGLRYLHMAKPMVVHRDLKLENLMLECECPPVLCCGADLGPRGCKCWNPAWFCTVEGLCVRTHKTLVGYPLNRTTAPSTPHHTAAKPGPDGMYSIKLADFGLSRSVAAQRQKILTRLLSRCHTMAAERQSSWLSKLSEGSETDLE